VRWIAIVRARRGVRTFRPRVSASKVGTWGAVSTRSSTRSAATSTASNLILVSTQDSNCYADSGINWRVVEGYGTVNAAQAACLPIRLGCPVTLIDHRGKPLAIETALGTLTADAAILTVPTPVLAAQGIRFGRGLADKIGAASVLPLGLADKLVMAQPCYWKSEQDRDRQLSFTSFRQTSHREIFRRAAGA
jgi:Flavin containing amine oxidoreductase